MTSQLSMDLPVSLPQDAYAYGERASGEAHGVVLTKRHVVELMHDLARYTSDRDLGAQSLLEPAVRPRSLSRRRRRTPPRRRHPPRPPRARAHARDSRL